jgi:hypothetical protein
MHNALENVRTMIKKRIFSGAHSSPMAGYGFGLGKVTVED